MLTLRLDQGSAEPRQATARLGHGRPGYGSGQLWERRHWGRARLYQWSIMDWSGDGRWHGHARVRWSGGRARLLMAVQGSGTCAAGQAEPGHGTTVEMAALRQGAATAHGKGGYYNEILD